MGKYNKLRFTHVTLKRFTKDRLTRLKNKIALHSIRKLNCSIDEAVSFLMDFYEQNSKQEYSIEKKLLSATSFSSTKLKVSVPLKKISSIDVVKKVDGKERYVYSVES